ncbi:MAG: twin-arginine translocation pathway signal [Rhodobacteraceae bacterium]|nr:twin-arginine translocation pathway signal [Paracoccaceae bacterium]
MFDMTRRVFIGGALAATTAACDNGVGSEAGQRIDARVDATLDHLYSTYPGTTSLRDKSVGVLVMPLITKAGFGLGGSYGEGALRINDFTVDYYSATSATFGLQIGAQQYSHVLFFLTEEALAEFRQSPGWDVGADMEYAYADKGENIGVQSTTVFSPTVAVIFGQTGLIAGATLEGTKYNRIIR